MTSTTRQLGLRPWHLLLVGLAAVVVFAWLPARCDVQADRKHGAETATRPARDPLRIVCTFLPTYVFTLNVIQGVPGVTAELLVSPNVGCPHEYSLRPEDLKRVARADIVVSNGLDLDPFLDQLRAAAPGVRILTISDDCQVICSTHEAGSSAGHDHAHNHADDHEANPHVWVSPFEAARQVTTLAGKLADADPAHGDQYRRNGAAYVSGPLARLQQGCTKLSASLAGRNRGIVTFHDAFAYLARDLNLQVVATLTQDPEHAPSARQIADTVNLIRQSGAAAIFYEPAYPAGLAQTISRETGAALYPLNPFNSMEGKPTYRSYEEVMEENLRVLARALGGSS